MKKLFLICGLAAGLAIPAVAQNKPAAKAAAPAAKEKRELNPNSITLLNNVLDHLKDAKHALDETSTDKAGHRKIAAHLLDQTTWEVEAQKKALEQEIQQYQEEKKEKGK